MSPEHFNTDQLETISGMVGNAVKQITLDVLDTRELGKDGGDARANSIGSSQFEVASTQDNTVRLHWHAGKTSVLEHSDAVDDNKGITVKGMLAEFNSRGKSPIMQRAVIHQNVDVLVATDGTIEKVMAAGPPAFYAA